MSQKAHKRKWRTFKTAQGTEPVRVFLAGLDDDEVAEVAAAMRDVRERGLVAARHLRGEVYEVRIFAARRSFRLLFAKEGKYGQVLLALTVFEKRTQRTPPRELEIAETRLHDWRARGAKRRA